MNILAGLGEVVCIGCLAALGCALVGSALVLRRRSMLGDAISHSVIAGIAVAYWVHPDPNSPWLRLGAIIAGCFAAWLTNHLSHMLRGKADAALALVFPAFFATGTLILSLVAANTHMDVDQVLSGNLESSWLERFTWEGHDIGPAAAWRMALFILILLITGWLFCRDITIQLFDPDHGKTLGRPMVRMEIGLILASTLVIVQAYDAMGPVLVVALLAGPGTSAWLFTHRLPAYFLAAAFLSQASTLSGIALAGAFDLNLAGSIATMSGATFVLVLVFAPGQGLLLRWQLSRVSRIGFIANLLLVHLFQHEINGDFLKENRRMAFREHLRLSEWEIIAGIQMLISRRLAFWEGNVLQTTPEGAARAVRVLEGTKNAGWSPETD